MPGLYPQTAGSGKPWVGARGFKTCGGTALNDCFSLGECGYEVPDGLGSIQRVVVAP